MTDSSTEGSATVDTSENSVVDAGSTSAPVVNAESTPAKEPSSVLDAVTAALSPDKGVDAASPAAVNRSPTGEPEPKDPSSSTEPAELSEAELKSLAPKTQERMRFLANERVELREQLDTIKPKAESYDKLTGYLAQNGISSDEANNSLEVTRLIKNGQYQPALKLLAPIYQELQKRAGEVLDPDLQEEVRLGTTPHERALELQRARAETAARRQQDGAAEERRKSEESSNAWQSHVDTISKAADNWAKGKAGGDPDWDKKADEVAQLVELDLRKNGFPKTVEDAVKRSDAALEQVNKRWNSRRPAPVEIRPNVGNGSRASTSGDTKPKSALDAVNIALG